MKILFITTYFAPDNAIAAKRLSMFAKILVDHGHDVTVIRRGSLCGIGYSADWCRKNGIKALSFQGENSPADLYEKNGTEKIGNAPPVQKRFSIIKDGVLRRFLRKIYESVRKFFFRPVSDEVRQIKHLIDQKLAAEKFDAVLASYGDLPNIFAGIYAKRKFHCPLVLDYRDPLYPRAIPVKFFTGLVEKFIQKKYTKYADRITTVSDGVKTTLAKYSETLTPIDVIYNGYAGNSETENTGKNDDGKLHFCYTGTFYKNSRLAPLLNAIQRLADNGSVNLSKLQFDYAGCSSGCAKEQLEKFGLSSILTDHGNLSLQEAENLQKKSDIFIVLAWNTPRQLGILSGKFYDAIKAKVPALALISGTLPDSELKQLIARYKLGFTYEEAADRKDYTALCDYIKMQYDRKMSGLPLEYAPEPEVFEHFDYKHLTKQLETILQEAVSASE